MVLWAKNQTLAHIQSELGLAKATCIKLSRLFRDIVFDKMITQFEPIGGEGKIVEIDESKFGKRKYNRGHRVEGQWVFGAYERGSGLTFMVPVEKRDRDTLLHIIHKWIKPGTTIYSDKEGI
jgi:ISXO2-like transposase domain